MSKYINLNAAIRILWELGMPLCDYESYAKQLESLPTIEVSEDCISKHDIWKIIEDNAYWVRYNENSTEKGMTLTGINQALNECPPVIPTVPSEDCISREQVRAELDYISYAEKDPITIAKRIVDNAPSVVPKDHVGESAEMVGEWIPRKFPYCWYYPTCSACGFENRGELNNYCPNCGADMRGSGE